MPDGPLITLPTFAEPRTGVWHFFGTRSDAVDPTDRPPLRGSPAGGTAVEPSHGTPHRAGGRPLKPAAVVSVEQVHGTDILVLDRPVGGAEPFPGTWDAIVTDQVGVLATVRTADCVPVLIHDPVGGVVAAVHAGWRGAIAGILPRTLSLMRRQFGSDPASLRMALGPSVGPCCYEVDAPVLERLGAAFSDWRSVVRQAGPDRAMLDLGELVRRQALLEGVSPGGIRSVRVCTVCHPDLFYSYRREGAVNGTMVSGIMLTRRGRG